MSEQKLLGDMTTEVLQKVGIDKLARAYERLTGRPCNCKNRQATLNRLHKMIIAAQEAQKPKPTQLARPPVNNSDTYNK